jgi:hypothetical protein
MSSSIRIAIALSCILGCRAELLQSQTVSVDIAPEHALNRIIPNQALGAGVDRLSIEAIDKTLTKAVLDQTAPSGWGPITYRQNTELAVEAWHWNPTGKWSDPHGRGYFTGSSTPGEAIRYSYGYSLPRRGYTRNDGTGNTGYSMLTDGDPNTFWKSNPYLTRQFTGEDDALHPQWVIVDLKKKESINAVRIAWGAPFARRYVIQYWTGDDPIGHATQGIWQTLPDSVATQGQGGTETVRISREPVAIQYLRVLMTESSNTCDADGPGDPRNCVGYAVREIYVGTQDSSGAFHDLVRHTPDQDQTTTYCSSVDPWHEPSDLVNKHQAHPGFDLFYQSGVTHGLPAMIPIAMIYSQPEDAVAEMRYLEARHYPVSYVEMGEEVDGQYMSPEDYGALYVQFARALHDFDPSLKLGGPAFQGVNEDITTWPDAKGNVSWLTRFLHYLKQHQRIADLAFFSFEHYPLDPCRFSWSGLYNEPQTMSHIMDVWRNDGLPANIPVFITESNLSSSGSEAYFDNFAGLWLADYIGSFLNAGGSGVYFFHYLPLRSYLGCNNSPGNFGMFTVDANYMIVQPLSQFFASEIINKEWLQPGDQVNVIFPSATDTSDGAGHEMVTSYAVERPDKQWSVMLVNRSQDVPYKVKVLFRNSGQTTPSGFRGSVESVVFGKEQYQWHPAAVLPMSHPESMDEPVIHAEEGYARPDGPATHEVIKATPDTVFTIPAASIVVLRGEIGTSE